MPATARTAATISVPAPTAPRLTSVGRRTARGTHRLVRTLDPAVLVATTGRDDQVDLLVVPPDTEPEAAARAMTAAADPANRRRAPDILATAPRPGPSAT
ncbi:DUF5994 family protein [Micromonospora sp. NPDC049004]|uniref:DUF5994 family protein n=1 Tax=unclassified Micromonospora TaxID=2617518 RepID=UPI0034008938